MSIIEAYTLAILTVLTIVTLLWLVSVPVRDASIIDMAWGPLFVAIAWALLIANGPAFTAKTLLMTALVTLWGLRLAFHLITRNLGAGEDKRYQLWRTHGGKLWWLKTYWRIYLLQGAIALCVATPVVAAFVAPTPLQWWVYLGCAVWAFGFIWELLADVQLSQYLLQQSRPPLLKTGVWKYSRHPNYFGDAVQWWGLAIVAFTTTTWWAPLGALAMTLTFAGTSKILERGMHKRHAEYEAYVTNTPKFIPRFFSR